MFFKRKFKTPKPTPNTMKVAFTDIRIFAAEFFYAWENGADFDWLKKEWHKFEPFLKDEREAEDFILALGYIYYAFCFESFFLKRSDAIATVQNYVYETESDLPEFVERTNNKLDFTLDLLLKVYIRPEEVLREIVSLAIAFELPHPDGYKYIIDLFKDKYDESEINFDQ